MKKRSIINCTLALAALWSFSASSHNARSGDDWPMFMKNAQRTGIAENYGQANNIKNLRPVWEYPLHTSVSASPIVAGNQLFVAAENGNLYSFDFAGKTLQWIFHAEAGIASTPAVANGMIYFLSRDGYFYALEQVSGKLAWRFATGGERRFGIVGGYNLPASMGVVPDPWDFYLSSPLVQGGKVYFGSSDHNVYALDAATGALVWTFTADDSIHSSPAYANGKIFIGTWNTKLHALDAQTGRELWYYPGGKDYTYGVGLGMVASPSVDERNVYIGSRDGFFYAFDQNQKTEKAETLWKYDAGGTWVVSTAAVDEKNVYFGTSDTGLFVALDKKTGTERYRSNTRIWTYTSPIIVQNNYAVVGTMAGELYAFDKSTGKKLWYYQTCEGRADINDLLDDRTGRLITDHLYDVQLQGGVEKVKTLGSFVASPIWIDNQLIAVTANGDLMVFETKGHRR
ncbi:MAG TPA: PQQ-binding-like beta-propeller repeat protein [Cellvibrio sp.]|nr:PQQ-binding-like beta-propeller repeat protein [Cellvibrio sp.]